MTTRIERKSGPGQLAMQIAAQFSASKRRCKVLATIVPKAIRPQTTTATILQMRRVR